MINNVDLYENISEKSSDTEEEEKAHRVGENGTKISGSKTTGKNGRVDVENPDPGGHDGDVHYHEPNNTKWRYDFKNNKLVNPKIGDFAPARIQKISKVHGLKRQLINL